MEFRRKDEVYRPNTTIELNTYTDSKNYGHFRKAFEFWAKKLAMNGMARKKISNYLSQIKSDK